MCLCSTVEDDIIVDQVDSPEIVDDFELGQDEVVDIKDKFVNKQKLKRRADQYKVILPYDTTQLSLSVKIAKFVNW